MTDRDRVIGRCEKHGAALGACSCGRGSPDQDRETLDSALKQAEGFKGYLLVHGSAAEKAIRSLLESLDLAHAETDAALHRETELEERLEAAEIDVATETQARLALKERLEAAERERDAWISSSKDHHDEAKELREENERLRVALTSIANNTCCEGCQEAARVAGAALTGEGEKCEHGNGLRDSSG